MTNSTERRSQRALATLLSLALVLVARPAWASGTGVGLVLFGLLGALPALGVGVVHVFLALRLLEGERRRVVPRVLGATVLAVVGSFVLQGFNEWLLRGTVWFVVALAIALGAYALAALPLSLALRREGKPSLAFGVFLASVLVAPLGGLVLLGYLSR